MAIILEYPHLPKSARPQVLEKFSELGIQNVYTGHVHTTLDAVTYKGINIQAVQACGFSVDYEKFERDDQGTGFAIVDDGHYKFHIVKDPS